MRTYGEEYQPVMKSIGFDFASPTYTPNDPPLKIKIRWSSNNRPIYRMTNKARSAYRVTIRNARLALLAGLSLTVAVGCTVLPHNVAAAKAERDMHWALYMEAVDQIEYIEKRNAFNGEKE